MIEEILGEYDIAFYATTKTVKELNTIIDILRIKYPNIEDFEIKTIE